LSNLDDKKLLNNRNSYLAVNSYQRTNMMNRKQPDIHKDMLNSNRKNHKSSISLNEKKLNAFGKNSQSSKKIITPRTDYKIQTEF